MKKLIIIAIAGLSVVAIIPDQKENVKTNMSGINFTPFGPRRDLGNAD